MSGDRLGKAGRVAWAVLTIAITETVVVALSVLPVALFWQWQFQRPVRDTALRVTVLAMSLVPAYLVFAISLLALSALSARLLGWRTPPGAEMRIADLEWPLLDWARYGMSTHVVRVLVGTLLRATPLWTLYHRLNGARLGRGVYLNSYQLADHNLLEFGDDVVIGADVHLSGHVVESGIVKTAPVRLGRGVTIGVGSVIGIGVVVEQDTQVGALSVVPKHRHLDGHALYGGVPVRRLDRVELAEG
jgi:acetyltransferase-like isoleucine patch superfamily enzyme